VQQHSYRTQFIHIDPDFQPLELHRHRQWPHQVHIKPTQLVQCTQAQHNKLCNPHNNDFTHPVFANTEFHKVNSDRRRHLLVMVGESWVYGGKIRDMDIEQYAETALSFSHAVHRTVGARAAEMLGADLYQYAYPGNNNYAMLYWLEQHLPELVNLPEYEQVFVLIQHTDQLREIGQPLGIQQLTGENSVWSSTLNRLGTGEHTWQNIEHWLTTYTAPITQTLNRLTELNSIKPVHILHWGNFAPVHHWQPAKFSVHPQSWTQFNAQLEGISIPDQLFHNTGMISAVYTQNSKTDYTCNVETAELTQQYWDSLSAQCLNLHNHYPSMMSHGLWAAQLTAAWRRAGLPSAPQIFEKENHE
jgi:hypothetical protein